jgi:GTP-binding protein
VKAGAGGDGSAAFRREDGVPRGGPSGGDGGNGGSVIVVADPHMASLLDFKFKRHYKAERGEHGRGKDQYGAAAADLVLKVPVGTVIIDEGTGEPMADLDEAGAQFCIAQGGIGGKGNIHFATPWNQAPKTAEPGTPGEERTVRLELKLLADVGLLGFPNVGKSTFISSVSRARPKVADYPFTTLVPNLGVVGYKDHKSFVVADIPGLIEGASEGAGLGHRFLRHVERCRLLVHVLDASAPDLDPERDLDKDHKTINRELARYSQELAARPQIIALNKCDLPEARARAEEFARKLRRRKNAPRVFLISAATNEGVPALIDACAEALWSGESAA